ncbi:MAG: hypothetical protein NBV61_07835 [Algoriphagus sp.]|nr:hypothetical protein [Algoriphagus sp.]
MWTNKTNRFNHKILGKIIISMIIFLAPSIAFGQFGVNYNQSKLPFVGLSFEIKDRFKPEVRFGTDNYFENITIESILSYDIINNDDYEFYGGFGVRILNSNTIPEPLESLGFVPDFVIPLGFVFYPLTSKNFGFQMELAPLIGVSNILRGSLGIRYKFKSKQVGK